MILNSLKQLNLSKTNVSLAIIKEYKKDRASKYDIKYVPIKDTLGRRLKAIVIRHIENSNVATEYTFDCPEPETDEVRYIDYESTDFYQILESLKSLNPEEDVVENVEELVKAKAYMIVLRDRGGIKIAAFKTLPENWKMKKSKGLIPLLYRENRFEDLEDNNVFSISGIVDLIYYNEYLLILSKKQFEKGLNFREGMINNANLMYEEVKEMELFINLDLLKNKVSNNQRYLRKIAIIRNLGHYKDQTFLQRLKEVSQLKGWNIIFNGSQICFTDDNIDDILTLLQNKRLHSQLTEQDFDVESAKLLGR